MRYRDIVILTRSVQGIADVFAEVLNREGIPAYAGTKEGYFDAWEVGVVLDYLRILDNRCQDIPLAAALVSPFGKVAETELAAIRSASPKKPFFEAVIEYLSPKAEDEEQPNPVIVEKLRHFFETLNHYQRMVPYTPMHDAALENFDRDRIRRLCLCAAGRGAKKSELRNADGEGEKLRVHEL